MWQAHCNATPVGASMEFEEWCLASIEDLVMRLLDKSPATRIGWADLPGHTCGRRRYCFGRCRPSRNWKEHAC